MSNGAGRVDKKVARESISVRESSGNVFQDLRVPENAEALAKAEIAARIAAAIEHRGLTQARAAVLFKVDQADVSDLVRGKLKGFSTERLFRFLNALGQDVEIRIYARHSRRAGHVRVLDDYPMTAGAGPRNKR